MSELHWNSKDIGKVTPNEEQTQNAVNAYLRTVITNPDSPPLDRTLSSNVSAAPADMVGALKSAINKTLIGEFKSFTLTNGYFINGNNGVEYDNQSNYSATRDFVSLSNHNFVALYSYLAGNAGIAFYDDSGNYKGGRVASASEGGAMLYVFEVPTGATKMKFSNMPNRLSNNDVFLCDYDKKIANEEILKIIGSTQMGTTATTLTGAIAEHTGEIDENKTDISRITVNDDLLNGLFDYAEEVDPSATNTGEIYRYSTNALVEVTGGGKAKKFTVDSSKQAYFVSTSMGVGSDGYYLISYFDSSNNQIGHEYPVPSSGDSISVSKRILNIPASAAWFYVNSRGANVVSHVYAIAGSAETVKQIAQKTSNLESKATILGKNVDVLQKGVNLGRKITPNEIKTGYLYNYSSDEETSVGGGSTISKVTIDSNVLAYFVTTAVTAGSALFPLVSYFDSNGDQLGYEYMNVAYETTAIEQVMLNIPDGTSYFYVNAKGTSPVIKAFIYGEEQYITKKDISILFVGNSMTQDAVSYVPYLLKHYYPEISFKFYIWYNAGRTLEEQYEYFTNDTPCDIFSVAENTGSWTNTSNSVKMSTILSTYKFDVVCMQEYFNYKESYTQADIDVWNDCKDYIVGNYEGGNGLEFITLFHAPKRTVLGTVYPLEMSANALILQKTIAQDMIPAGIAIYNALSTPLDELGDAGHLCPINTTTGLADYTHAQEGVPCLLEALNVVCWILDKLAIQKSVYGCPLRMTTAIYESINVPGPNLGTGVITGTDEQNLLAQEVAIQAYKQGKSFVNKNIYVEPAS